jgi:hypothetical protein
MPTLFDGAVGVVRTLRDYDDDDPHLDRPALQKETHTSEAAIRSCTRQCGESVLCNKEIRNQPKKADEPRDIEHRK